LLLTLAASVIALSILIFVHELGHFTAAKRSGVRIERFSMGMGPKIVGFTMGETEYVLSAIPFGGYVRMSGEDPESEGGGHDWEFMSKNKRTRAFIVLAGPAMNFLLAIVIFAGLAGYTGVETITTRVVGDVIEDTPAWQAGFREGDEITSVSGRSVGSWDEILDVLADRLGARLEIGFIRNGVEETATLDLVGVDALATIGIYSFRRSTIGEVKHGGPAYLAGIRKGDHITMIDAQPIRTWSELRGAIRQAPGKELAVAWERDGKPLSATVVPRESDGYGLIDVTYNIEKRPVGFVEAIGIGLDTTIWVSKQILQFPRFFAMVLTGRASRDMVGGPVRIGELAGEVIRWGITSFLGFIAAISAQLSLLNLLPIPVLDGGHILLLGIETVTRKPITPRQRMIAHQIGFVFLFSMMVLVTLFDVSRFFGK
jgi:regulator of sigma E protease